jgi:hypothetical protein
VSSRGRDGDRDDWLISDLRQRARTIRVGGALLGDDDPGRPESEPAALLGRLESVEGTVADLRVRLGRVEGEVGRIAVPGHEHEPGSGHVLFFAGEDGYRLVEAEGLPPEIGAELEHGGERFRVLRLGRSPLPGDRRICVILERLEP